MSGDFQSVISASLDPTVAFARIVLSTHVVRVVIVSVLVLLIPMDTEQQILAALGLRWNGRRRIVFLAPSVILVFFVAVGHF